MTMMFNAFAVASTVVTMTALIPRQARNAARVCRQECGARLPVRFAEDRKNAGFRLGSVASVNARQGSSCTYNVVISQVPVACTTIRGSRIGIAN